jgi:sodium-coupled neutral amino acid transporter 11
VELIPSNASINPSSDQSRYFLRQGQSEHVKASLLDNGSHTDDAVKEEYGGARSSNNEDESEQGDLPPVPLGPTFNMLNSIVGAGIIGIPFAFNHTGFIMGVVMLFCVAGLTYYGVRIIVSLGVAMHISSYEELCRKCLGRAGFYAVSMAMFTSALGAMCAYLIIIGDTIPQIVKSAGGGNVDRRPIILFVSIFVILPLSLLKDMSLLERSSLISVTADAFIVLLIFIRAAPASESEEYLCIDSHVTFAEPTLFAGVGTMSFAFVCQQSTFLVFNTVKPKDNTAQPRFFNVAKAAIGAALALCLCLGMAGWLAFRNGTQANLLNNFAEDDDVVNGARALLAVTMMFTFPMEQFVARQSLHTMVWEGKEFTNTRHYALSLLLWGSATLIAIVTSDLGVVLELTGSIGSSMLGYILPAACFLFSRPDLYRDFFALPASQRYQAAKHLAPAGAMLVVGTLAMVFGVLGSLSLTGEVAEPPEPFFNDATGSFECPGGV